MHSSKTKSEILAILQGTATHIVPAGSQYTCNPPPDMATSDEDWLVHTWTDAAALLIEAGFTQQGQPEFYTGNEDGGFKSWRRGEVNLIITQDLAFFNKFRTATELARRFNLLEKQDRIALFQAVLYGVGVESLEAKPYQMPRIHSDFNANEEVTPLFTMPLVRHGTSFISRLFGHAQAN